MEIYRLKHKPTGLYFQPSKGNGNLSAKGKLYVGRKPNIDWAKSVRVISNSYRNKRIQSILCEYFKLPPTGWNDKHFKTLPSDWEIETVK